MSVDARIYDQYLKAAISAVGNGSLTIFHFSKEARDQAREELERFIDEAGELLEGIEPSQIGRDFWLTRNRSDAGFAERDLGMRGQALTAMCCAFGELSAYVDADGKVYFS